MPPNVFKPNGQLNVATAATDLPDDGLARCKNLKVDQFGRVFTRDGSSRIHGKEDRRVPASSSDFIVTYEWEKQEDKGTGVNFTLTDSTNARQYTYAWEVPKWGGNDDPWLYRAMHVHEQMGLEEIEFWLLHMLEGKRYSFAGDQIFKDETSISSGNTSAQWSAINYNQFNDTTKQIYALNGTDRKRIDDATVVEWGIEPPTLAAVISAGSGSGLTGNYGIRYTYAKLVGTTVVSESNPSPDSGTISLSDESLSITWTASSDSQVTHVRIYRTRANGSTHNLISSVAIGTTTIDDNTADTLLGNEIATNHDRPPTGTFVLGPNYNGTCFIIKDNLLHFSLPKQPEYWPTTFFIEVSPLNFPGKVGVFWNGQPYILSSEEIYYIQGSGQGTFFPLPMRARTGSQGHFGAVAVSGKGIFHTGPDGIYLFTGANSDSKVTQALFDPLFGGSARNGMPGVNSMDDAVLHYYNGKLYFAYADSDDDYPANLIVFNLDNNRATYHRYNDGSYDIEFRTMANDLTNDRLLIGDDAGFVRLVEAGTKDSVKAIDWELQSKDWTLQTRAHFPRWNKYDIDASAADSVTGAILLDDAVHQTHAITGTRKTRRRLIDTGNGERAAFRVSGTGVATIYAVEGE